MGFGLEGLIIFLIVGAVAGWLAGLIVKGYGFGILGNMVIGIWAPSSAAGCSATSESSRPAGSSAS